MSKKPVVVDPLMPKTPIEINGTTYFMCLNLGALAQAEEELVAQGRDVNLLVNLPPINLRSTRIIFAASLRQFHPDIPYEDALELLTMPYVHAAYSAVIEAWNKAMPEPNKGDKNPTEPGSEPQS